MSPLEAAVRQTVGGHPPLISTPTYANGRVTGCRGCDFEGDGEEYLGHLSDLVAALLPEEESDD